MKYFFTSGSFATCANPVIICIPIILDSIALYKCATSTVFNARFSENKLQSTNYWGDPEYKGINTRWITQQGQRFEVQFHTPESFHAKEVLTHKAYERIRDTTTSRPELRELHAFQRELSAWIQVPDGAADIPDFKKEGF